MKHVLFFIAGLLLYTANATTYGRMTINDDTGCQCTGDDISNVLRNMPELRGRPGQKGDHGFSGVRGPKGEPGIIGPKGETGNPGYCSDQSESRLNEYNSRLAAVEEKLRYLETQL